MQRIDQNIYFVQLLTHAMRRTFILFLVAIPFVLSASDTLSNQPFEKDSSQSTSSDILSQKNQINQSPFWKQFKEDSLWSFRSRNGFLKMFLYNMACQATSPLRMTEGQSLVLMGAAGITATLYFFDEDLDKEFRPLRENNKWLDKSSPHVTEFGGYYGYAFLVFSGTYSLISKNHKLLHTTVLAVHSGITSGLWVRAGKLLTGRMSPGLTYENKESRSDDWSGPFAEFKNKEGGNFGKDAYHSFPSGHTATAFSIATVFAGRYADRRWVPVFSYTLASAVAFTRLVEHEHWASDILPGALIGYACGRQNLSNYYKSFPQYKNRRYNRRNSKLELSVIPMTKAAGLHCSLRF